MAFVAANPNLQEEEDKNQAPGAQATGGAVVNSGAPAGSGGVSTAGVNAGGGGWTNIQSYLTANQGNNNTAQGMQQQVGSVFDEEKKKVADETGKLTSDAKTQVEGNKIAPDAASQLIQQAGQGDSSAVQKVKGSLGAQYAGPEAYEFGGLGTQAVNYGSGLQSQQNFQGLVDEFHRGNAGGRLGSGGMALQRQLDARDGGLDDARTKLLDQYSGLNGFVESTVADTNSALTGFKDQFGADQKALTDYLETQDDARVNALQSTVDYQNDQVNQKLRGLGDGAKYTGTMADLNNVADRGEREEFNAIMEMLSRGDRMHDPSNPWALDQSAFTTPGAVTGVDGTQYGYVQGADASDVQTNMAPAPKRGSVSTRDPNAVGATTKPEAQPKKKKNEGKPLQVNLGR